MISSEIARPRKFRNVPTSRGSIRFASKREANRYDLLKLLEKNGELRNLQLQVSYRLEVNAQLICTYRADFVYEELRKGQWQSIVEDVKGFATPAYRLKKRLMQAVHGITIRET